MSPPLSFNHRKEKLSTGNTYHFVDQFPPLDVSRSPNTLLCIHGFPDMWFGWRNQIHAWASEGNRVIVPDMLGYGETDKPKDLEKYSTKNLCNDLAALLDLLNVSKCVVIGHDWGSYISSRFALWHPNRLEALVIMSVPFTPPLEQYFSPEELVKRAPNLGYQLDFSKQEATAIVESNVPSFVRLIFQAPAKGEAYVDFTEVGALQRLLRPGSTNQDYSNCILTLEEFDYYARAFSGKDVMDGPLNYYRTSKLRYEEEKEVFKGFERLPEDLAVLFICGTLDRTARPASVKTMAKHVPNLQVVWLPDVGHWVMVEASREVTERVAKFIATHILRSKL